MPNDSTPALQQVLIELRNLGIQHPRDSDVYKAIRWLLAEHAYARLSEASSSQGIALANMRQEAAYWKEQLQLTQKEKENG
jgi:hypothetical protein